MKDRIDTGVAVHAAYHQSSQHKPRVAERLVKGWQSMRNMAYRHAKKDGTTMPSDPKGIGRYLKDRDLDGNLYEQVLRREIYDKEKTTQEDIEDWKERRGKFYLGDAKTKATYQFWCPRWGAEQLATGYRIYVDKATPRIARLKRPYKGVLHFLVGHKNENNEWVPHTTPCASILLEEAHAKSQVFVTAFARLQQLCLQEYGIDIINNTARTELITMGDMEVGLREAVDVLWSH
eukprot:437341_1